MSETRLRKRLASRRFVADDDDVEKTITTLEEQLLSDELDTEDVPSDVEDTEVPPVIQEEREEVKDEAADDDAEIASIVAAADALLAAQGDATDATVPDDTAIISKECDDVAQRIASIERMQIAADEKKQVEDDCDALSQRIASIEKNASEEKPGIEDEIGDEAHGGDPSVSEITKTKIDCATDKEVFPTNSEYVANITKRLDRVANILEKRGMKRLAFRVDQLSDKLESSVK